MRNRCYLKDTISPFVSHPPRCGTDFEKNSADVYRRDHGRPNYVQTSRRGRTERPDPEKIAYEQNRARP